MIGPTLGCIGTLTFVIAAAGSPPGPRSETLSPAYTATTGTSTPPDRFAEPADTLEKVLDGKDATGTPPGPPREIEFPPPSAESGEDRPVPDYAQREGRNPSAGEVLIWVPRAVFYPVHLTLEYLLRRPLVWTITRAEEIFLFERIRQLLTFRDGKSVIFPSFFGDFGLRPSVGLANANDDLFTPGNTLDLSASFGGSDFFRVAATNATTVLRDRSGTVRLFGSFETRADQPYYGTGPFTRTEQEVDPELGFRGGRYTYKIRRLEAGVGMRALLADLTWIDFGARFKDIEFGDDGLDDGPTANERSFEQFRRDYAAQFPDDGCTTVVRDDGIDNRPRCSARGIVFPQGFDEVTGQSSGYQLLEARVEAKLDSRSPDTEADRGTGVLLELFGSFEFDPSNTDTNFFRWGGEAAAFYDLSGVGHVLALRVYGEFVEETGSDEGPVPFTELPTLGGLEDMRGFLARRFIGDSVFMLSGSYRYPVWSLLDAELFAGVGNAFDGHYRGFSWERLHLNGGLSIRTNLSRETSFQILIAVGTRRLEETETDDFRIDSFRFAFGVAQGF